MLPPLNGFARCPCHNAAKRSACTARAQQDRRTGPSAPAPQSTEQDRFNPDSKPHRKYFPGVTEGDEMKHTYLTALRSGHEPEASSGIVPRIVLRLEVIDTEWPDCGDLGNVFTGFRPVEVRRIAG